MSMPTHEELNQLKLATITLKVMLDYLEQVNIRANMEGVEKESKERIINVVEYDLGHFTRYFETFKNL